VKNLKTFKILFIKMSFLGLAFQGCGAGSPKSKKTYPTSIGTAVSLTREEERTNNLNQELSKMMQTHLAEINQQEATSFSKTTTYCDISGLKDFENSGDLYKIITKTNYQSCENDKNTQNGDTIMTYEQTDDDGKFPELLTLVAQNNYNFNNINLQKDASIECNIDYNEDKSIQSMTLLISGTVEFNSQTYVLNNHQEIINF
jgi:hypothetical protein